MKTFTCQCGARLHFESSLCVGCQHELGFLPDDRTHSALKPIDENRWQAIANGRFYRKCSNYQQHQVCNWMVPEFDNEADNNVLCYSCRLSEIIPNLNNPDNINLWKRIEHAKRRLIYSLLWLELPIVTRQQDPQQGLAFHLLEDKDQGFSEFATMQVHDPVMTGHRSGVITLNIAEADPIAREQSRTQMQEAYRTLLGHFRHESGHYYWDMLVKDSPRLEAFRQRFGDERIGYAAVLQGYYANGPVANWEETWISAYASSHSWEDWAETWAHYLHMIDTLETASDYGLDLELGMDKDSCTVPKRPQFSAEYLSSISINDLVSEWRNLTVVLNDLNRSMGMADAYPFVLSKTIVAKLAFVHDVVTQRD